MDSPSQQSPPGQGDSLHPATEADLDTPATEAELAIDWASGKPFVAFVLGDYELFERIGVGAMGAVFKARQVSKDRPAAVKVLRNHLASDPLFLERFVREAEVMARLRHPNVVRCYGLGKQRGHYYLSMELIEGRSLGDWLAKLGRLSVGDAVHVILACARALQHLHQNGLVHRDVKPSNLLLTTEGRIKIVDLGLARALLEEDVLSTPTGHGAGTPMYVSPEQARDARDADPRSDLYSLGCMLYHMLAGRAPFVGDRPLDVVLAKLDGKYEPIQQVVANLPEGLADVVAMLLCPHPDERYQSATDLVCDLEKLRLASPALSFLGGHTEPATTVDEGPGTDADIAPTTADATVRTEKRWYVRWRHADGGEEVRRMTAGQVRDSLHDEAFACSAEASLFRGGYRPLEEVAEFHEVVSQHRHDHPEEPERPVHGGRVSLALLVALVTTALALGVWLGLTLAN